MHSPNAFVHLEVAACLIFRYIHIYMYVKDMLESAENKASKTGVGGIKSSVSATRTVSRNHA